MSNTKGKDSSIKRKVKIVIWLLILDLICICYISHYQEKYKTEVNMEYCQEIADEYHSLKLKLFYCSSIYAGENKVIFSFHLKHIPNIENGKDYDEFEEECIKDINKIKILTENYLINNSNHELNEKRILFDFNTIAGDSSYMRNYDYLADEKEQDKTISQHFLYFEKIWIDDISEISGFSDAYSLDINVCKIDDISIFKEFKNLKYLNTTCNFTEDDKEYLMNILPNCTIVCNGETIQTIQHKTA